MELLAALAIGGLIGAASVYLWSRPERARLQEATAQLSRVESELKATLALAARAESQAARVPDLEQRLATLLDEKAELLARASALEAAREADRDKFAWIEQAGQKLSNAFQALASEALKANSDEFLKRAREGLETLLTGARGDLQEHRARIEGLVAPLEKALESLDGHVRELEQKREGAYRSLEQELRRLAETSKDLHGATASLAGALKSSGNRGRWGEVQLRRIVDLAGMVKHVDFVEQPATDSGRPDMIIHLPGKGVIPVDAKTSTSLYLEALEAPDERTRDEKLRGHARAVRRRIEELAGREYWKQFEHAPQFVVMFVPGEAALCAAFEYEPDLLEDAIRRGVLITTPVTLVALLKAVAYGWHQHEAAEHARLIWQIGRDFFERLQTFLKHLGGVGQRLTQLIEKHNEAVGSLQSRLLPAARRFRELAGIEEELTGLDSVTVSPRILDEVGGETENSEAKLESGSAEGY